MGLGRIIFKVTIAVILLLLGIIVLQGERPMEYWTDKWCLVFHDLAQQVEKIEQQYGVTITHDLGDSAIPAFWRRPPANAVAVPMTKLNLCGYLPVLSYEIQKYPPQVIRRDVENIYLLNNLSFYDVEYGGTSLGRAIYLTGGDKSEGYDDAYFARLFHHEMSSIFFNAYQFPAEAWSSINGQDFHYAQSDGQVLKAIASGKDSGGNETMYQAGFLAEYGYSTLENDFNLYAEMLFVSPQELSLLADKYDKVRKKTDLAKHFYRGVSKDFMLDNSWVESREK